ncbi:Bifunctional fucokinase/fucose pyrophosphorylase [Nymphaea thermarum]|nr:Bifunctional fucokinase/fucose pyrophosphorylase [Nymphaea thermarum]
MKTSIDYGLLGRKPSQLCTQILQNMGIEVTRDGLEDHLWDPLLHQQLWHRGVPTARLASTDFCSCESIDELSVPIHVVGGRSDTPLLHARLPGSMLNKAITWKDPFLVGAEMGTITIRSMWTSDDALNQNTFDEVASFPAPFDQGNPFHLVKLAPFIIGFGLDEIATTRCHSKTLSILASASVSPSSRIGVEI